MGKREKALAMLRFFTEDSVLPYNWNHMAEVVHARKRAPSYIGDMPHTWVGSGYINAVRSIFAFEHDARIVMAAGIDPTWPAKGGVNVSKLPTQYGTLTYAINDTEQGIVIDVRGKAVPPQGFEIPLPEAWQDHIVMIDGESADVVDGTVRFDALPVKIVLVRPWWGRWMN
jgi:hypothetical protein